LNTKITLEQHLPSGRGTYATLVQRGIFIRPAVSGKRLEETSEEEFVPILPLLPLYIWASKSDDEIVKTLYQFMTRCSSATLKNDQDVLTFRGFYGEGWEMIHTWYSVLRLQLEGLANNMAACVRLLVLAHGQRVSKASDLRLDLEMEDKLSGMKQPFKKFIKDFLNTPHTTILLHLGGQFPDADVLCFESMVDLKQKIKLTLQQHKYYPAKVFDNKKNNRHTTIIEETWSGYRFPDKEFEDVEIQISVEFFILGKVSSTVPRGPLDGVRVHDTTTLEQMYGPTLFSLVRPINNSWTE